jgi:streptogramin lyase
VSDFLTELREELLDGLDRYERTRWWRRAPSFAPLGRRLAVVAAAAAAVFAGVQIIDSTPDVERPTTPALTRLEGFHATQMVVADGSLWATQANQSNLLRIDPVTGAVRARIETGGSPGAVVAGGGAIWVHDWELGRLVKVDPRTNRVVKALALHQVNSGDVAFGAGSVWAAADGDALLRIDPRTVAVTKRAPLGAAASRAKVATLVVNGDVVWVVMDDGAILEVDAGTGGILGRAHGPVLPAELARRVAADDGGLWISSPARREVVHVDERSRHIRRFPVGGDPSPLAIVDGRVWVGTLHETGTLTRVTVLDEGDGHVVRTLPLPLPAVNIAPWPGGGAWVSFGEDTTVNPAAIRISGP